jgi:hypothetical protein
MPTTMKVKIPLMVGSNGKWSAYGHGELGEPHDCDDWGMIADNLLEWPERGDPIAPDAMMKHYVTVEIEVPDGVTEVAGATVIKVG